MVGHPFICGCFPYRKLRSAREKLHQLQDLVALVQQSPDAPGAMPENLGRVAPGIEDETALLATQRDEANMSVNIGELPLESVGIPQRSARVCWCSLVVINVLLSV